MEGKSQLLLLVGVALALACGSNDDDQTAGPDGGPCVDGGGDGDTDTGTDTGALECDLGQYEGSAEVFTPEDLATLAGYTSIEGDLVISCHACADLSPLACLVSVGCSLEVILSTELENLDDLAALTAVGACDGEDDGTARLRFEGNPALTSIEGLGNVAEIPRADLRIVDNAVLESLDGLEQLTQLRELIIERNPVLTDLDGLNGVTTFGDAESEIRIVDNDSLTDLDGLSAITASAGQWMVTIAGNAALNSLEGLGGVESCVYGLEISENPALSGLDGLHGIVHLHGDLLVSQNPTLPDCEVCELLEQLEEGPSGVTVEDNLDDACTPVPDGCPDPDAGPDGG